MARPKLSVEEQRKREYQRKMRERINSDPESRRHQLEKEKQRWKDRVQNKTVKQIGELGPRAKRHHRKYWRKAKKRSRALQNRRLNEMDTPPAGPH